MRPKPRSSYEACSSGGLCIILILTTWGSLTYTLEYNNTSVFAHSAHIEMRQPRPESDRRLRAQHRNAMTTKLARRAAKLCSFAETLVAQVSFDLFFFLMFFFSLYNACKSIPIPTRIIESVRVNPSWLSFPHRPPFTPRLSHSL